MRRTYMPIHNGLNSILYNNEPCASSTWFGAREHALVLSLFHDPAVDDIHVAPGNVGMKPLATLHSEVTRIDDPDTVVALARDIAADLVVIGQKFPWWRGSPMRCDPQAS